MSEDGHKRRGAITGLAHDEALLASVEGLERRDGWARRRVTVAATDRRLLLVWRRPGGAVVDVAYEDLTSIDLVDEDDGALLEIHTPDADYAVRRLEDRQAVSLLCQLVAGRCERAAPQPGDRPPGVRVIDT